MYERSRGSYVLSSCPDPRLLRSIYDLWTQCMKEVGDLIAQPLGINSHHLINT
jgi:hypothetical protein